MRFFSILSFFCLSSLLVTEGAVIVTLGNVDRVVSAGSTLHGLVVSWNGNGWNIDSKNVLSKYVRNVVLVPSNKFYVPRVLTSRARWR